MHIYKPLPEERISKVVDYYLAMPKPSYAEALVKGGGYTRSTANSSAHKFFQRPDVKLYLEKRRQELADSSGVTTEMLVQQLKSIAFGDLSKYIKVSDRGGLSYDFTGATPDELRLVSDLQVDSYVEGRGSAARNVKKFKFSKWDQLRAIEMLGRILGAFKDKTEVSGEISLVERLQRGRQQIRGGG